MRNSWQSPRVKALCDRVGIAAPERAILHLASKLVQRGRQHTPPISTDALTRLRGITQIREVPLTVDAYIVPDETGYAVYVNSRQPFTRKRFSIAHEIIHTFFFEAAGAQEKHRSIDSTPTSLDIDAEEEYLCNIGAAELLMPSSLFGAEQKQRRLAARTFAELASVFQVSAQAAAIRYCSLTGRRFVLLALKSQADGQQDKGLLIDWWVKPDQVRTYPPKDLTIGQSSPLFRTLQDGSLFSGRQALSLGGSSEDYFVDAVRIGIGAETRVLALVLLEQNPEHAIRTLARSSPQIPLAS